MDIVVLKFILVASSVFIGINLFVYFRFLRRVFEAKKARNFIKFLLFILIIFELSFVLSLRVSFHSNWHLWLGASLIGVSFMLFVLALVYEFFMLFFKTLPFSTTRRKFLKICFDITMLILAFSYIFKGFVDGLSLPKVKNIKIKIKNLQNSLNIVQISDIHIGEFLKKDYLAKLVKLINKQNPDIVAITGDLVDKDIRIIYKELEPLKDIKSKFGVFFVAGNHEYYNDVEPILNYLEQIGIIVLRNTNKQIANINLAGVYDVVGKRLNHKFKPDVKAALKGIDERFPTILLAHQPKQLNYLENENIDLVLSGHTHAGQIFPFNFLVKLDQPYVYGLHKHSEKTQIYITSGAGFWGPPIRFLAPAEIANITLKKA